MEYCSHTCEEIDGGKKDCSETNNPQGNVRRRETLRKPQITVGPREYD